MGQRAGWIGRAGPGQRAGWYKGTLALMGFCAEVWEEKTRPGGGRHSLKRGLRRRQCDRASCLAACRAWEIPPCRKAGATGCCHPRQTR